MLPPAILLGPQRRRPRVREAVAMVAEGNGAIACVTAGWEEREGETDELFQHLGRPAVDLAIWRRVEEILERDQELLAAMRGRHDALRTVQQLYRMRLSGLMDAARGLFRLDGALAGPERDGAIAMLRQLDREHEERVASIHAEFDQRFRPAERDSVRRHRRKIERTLEQAACVCIAGGHVGALLHRMRLFGLHRSLERLPVVAWSAGAMVLCERIVLFHDDPPQGQADAEVMERGFGRVEGVVALPHARRRLRLDDALRVSLMARRFEPWRCVTLDEDCSVRWDGARWTPSGQARELGADGALSEMRP
ncbi:MAG: hypothetical protein Fur0037_07800 [Planctomycetota bacterium]